MRKKIVAGNWKMNTTLAEGVELAKGITEQVNDISKGVSLIVAPPFTHLAIIAQMLKGTPVTAPTSRKAPSPVKSPLPC